MKAIIEFDGIQMEVQQGDGFKEYTFRYGNPPSSFAKKFPSKTPIKEVIKIARFSIRNYNGEFK